MKTLAYILLVLSVLASILWFARKNIYQRVVTSHLNEKMPGFELTDLDSSAIKLGDYQGKILVLDFWTTWCGACTRAFPDFKKLYARYENNPDVAFLAVNTSEGNDSIDKVRRFMEQNRYPFPVAYDADAVLTSRFGIKYYPTLMIIDRAGRLRIKHIGYSQSLEDYETLISKYIDELLAAAEHSDSSEILNFYFSLGNLMFSDNLVALFHQAYPKVGIKSDLGITCFLSLDNRIRLNCKILSIKEKG